MKVCVLSSGSKGNTTYIESANAKILIDIGNTAKYVKDKLEKFGVKPDELDAILITHTHVDHIKGLKVFEKKYNIPVYMTEKMFNSVDCLDGYELLLDNGYFKQYVKILSRNNPEWKFQSLIAQLEGLRQKAVRTKSRKD
jgi:phosphoribosyl 1,2-cyclic phosphodiesterase